MTLPPLPDLPQPDGTAEKNKERHPEGGYTFDEVDAWSEGLVRAYATDYARAAIAAHVPESAFGNIAAVPAQPVAWLGGDGHPHHISAVQTITERRIYGPWQPLYAAPQAVPVPAGWSVTYDGKRASYIYADQETAEFEAQQVGGTARAVAVYLAAAPKEQPHE